MKIRARSSGFTLIELLVVIAIIGLLSSIILASLDTARMKGRDSQRVQEMKEVENALDVYALDNGGTYPASVAANGPCGRDHCLSSLAGVLSPKYISVIPADPVYANTSKDYLYCAFTTVPQYTLLTWSEANNTWCTMHGPANIQTSGCWTTNGVPAFDWCGS